MNPKDSQNSWYIAELIFEINVQDDRRNVVHRNLMLIEASSDDQAYDKAVQLGHNNEITYENPENKEVRIRYRGISKLNVIYDSIEDGAELLYDEEVDMDSSRIRDLLRTKLELALFRPNEGLQGPDYRAKDVVIDAENVLRKAQ